MTYQFHFEKSARRKERHEVGNVREKFLNIPNITMITLGGGIMGDFYLPHFFSWLGCLFLDFWTVYPRLQDEKQPSYIQPSSTLSVGPQTWAAGWNSPSPPPFSQVHIKQANIQFSSGGSSWAARWKQSSPCPLWQAGPSPTMSHTGPGWSSAASVPTQAAHTEHLKESPVTVRGSGKSGLVQTQQNRAGFSIFFIPWHIYSKLITWILWHTKKYYVLPIWQKR